MSKLTLLGTPWVLALFAAVHFLGCGGSHPKQPLDRVYVVGHASTGVIIDNAIPNQALIWIDGSPKALSPGSPSFALALARSEGRVHAVGQDTGPDGLPRPMHWIDGAPDPLPAGPMGDAYPTCILVSGGKTTIGGNARMTEQSGPACFWIDGQLQPLASEVDQWSRIESLAQEGGLLRAAGSRSVLLQVGPNMDWLTHAPLVWQDGQAGLLGEAGKGGDAFAMQILDGHVYAAGAEYRWISSALALPHPVARESIRSRATSQVAFHRSEAFLGNSSPAIATWWKDGLATNLTDGQRWARATGIWVRGSDVFVSGLQQVNANFDAAVYWKNGLRVDLTQGQSEARTSGIAVEGDDVYVCGYEVLNGVCVATLWKNGVPTRLGDGVNHSFATGLVVQRTW